MSRRRDLQTGNGRKRETSKKKTRRNIYIYIYINLKLFPVDTGAGSGTCKGYVCQFFWMPGHAKPAKIMPPQQSFPGNMLKKLMCYPWHAARSGVFDPRRHRGVISNQSRILNFSFTPFCSGYRSIYVDVSGTFAVGVCAHVFPP